MTLVANDIQMIYAPEPEIAGNAAAYLKRIRQWLALVSQYDKTLDAREWTLTGDSKEEARLYGAFDGEGAAEAALAVIRTRKKTDQSPFAANFTIWNGHDAERRATIMVLDPTAEGSTQKSNCEISLRDRDGSNRLGSPEHSIAAFSLAISQWKPLASSFGPYDYDDHKVFPDRYGAGWMLYLPKVITRKQVPEAGDLVPVMDGNRPLGTIIVSVADGIFSTSNPQHVRTAKAIEVRLVDQDLLPTFQQIHDQPMQLPEPLPRKKLKP